VALDTATKKQIMTEFGTKEGDTGSPEVQVAMLSRRISDLTEHLKTHKHDHHSVVACSSWSASVAACCSTWPRRTSSASVCWSSASVSAAVRPAPDKTLREGAVPD